MSTMVSMAITQCCLIGGYKYNTEKSQATGPENRSDMFLRNHDIHLQNPWFHKPEDYDGK
jgi:hypothetical protein